GPGRQGREPGRRAVRELRGRDRDLDREGVHAVVRQADRGHRRDDHGDPLRSLLHHPPGRRQHHGAVGARADLGARGAQDPRLSERPGHGARPRRELPDRDPGRRAGPSARELARLARRSHGRRSADLLLSGPPGGARRRAGPPARASDRSAAGGPGLAPAHRRRVAAGLKGSTMNGILQILAIIGVGLRTLRERLGAFLATVFGVAGVVAVFVGVLSIGEGFRAAMRPAGADDMAMVMRTGNDSEMMSGLSRESTEIVKQAPGVASTGASPVASAELFVVIDLPKRSTGTEANVPLRGVQPTALAVRGSGMRIVEGRMLAPGTNEVIVGRAASREFSGLDLGAVNRWGKSSWKVVGIFDAGG